MNGYERHIFDEAMKNSKPEKKNNVSASGSNELLCDLDAEFKKNTKHKVTIYGFEINCKKGLWGVCAPTEKQALNEAKYYFRQYFEDGEYT